MRMLKQIIQKYFKLRYYSTIKSFSVIYGLPHNYSFFIFIILLFISSSAYSQDSLNITYVSSFGSFIDASSIAVDPENNIYIIDRGTNKLFKYSPDLKTFTSFGGYGWSEQTFDNPVDICISFGINIYITDYNNHRIQRFDKNLNYISTYSSRNNPDAGQNFGFPNGICISNKGELFFGDLENKRVIKYNAFGEFEKSIGDLNAGLGKLDNPAKMRIDENDHLYVLDDRVIKIFDRFGNFIKKIDFFNVEVINSFFINQNLLYLVNKRNLDVINNSGKYTYSIKINNDDKEEKNFNDILINGENLFLLSSGKVYLFKITKY
jgi:hypothetical protein